MTAAWHGWPCICGGDPPHSGLDCGPDQSRKKAGPKSATELAAIRAAAWETRRTRYGQAGHS